MSRNATNIEKFSLWMLQNYTCNAILSNYDKCTEQMKLVVNSIVLSLNEITQTDRQRSGIFCHTDKNEVIEDYTKKQIVSIIEKITLEFFSTNTGCICNEIK